jgi:hypothetical protein
MPRHQYQIWQRIHGEGLQLKKTSINGINSVRLYLAMHDITLDQLVVSGGRGDRVLRKMLADLRDWQLKSSELELPEPLSLSTI